MVLNESAEKILRSNVNILFDQLEKAVNEYLCNGHSRGNSALSMHICRQR